MCKIWTRSDAQLADNLLVFVNQNAKLSDSEVVDAFVAEAIPSQVVNKKHINYVWSRLTTEFPHMLAVTAERGTLNDVELFGDVAAKANRRRKNFFLHDSWKQR